MYSQVIVEISATSTCEYGCIEFELCAKDQELIHYTKLVIAIWVIENESIYITTGIAQINKTSMQLACTMTWYNHYEATHSQTIQVHRTNSVMRRN